MRLRISFGSHPQVMRVLQLCGNTATLKVKYHDNTVAIGEFTLDEIEPASRTQPYNRESIRKELESRAEVVLA